MDASSEQALDNCCTHRMRFAPETQVAYLLAAYDTRCGSGCETKTYKKTGTAVP